MDFIYGYRAPTFSELEKTGGGVAAGDFDGDGLVDLFIARGDIGPNLLYRNLGNNRFEDVAADVGLAYTKSDRENYRHAAPIFADIDGDGDLDLLLGAIHNDPVKVYSNDLGKFTDVTAGSGLTALKSRHTVGAAFGDMDLDGDLDLALAHWGTPHPNHLEITPETETLWRNDSDTKGIKFTDVSVAANISPSIVSGIPGVLEGYEGLGIYDYTYTPTFARMNDDLYPELIMVADVKSTRYFSNQTAITGFPYFEDKTDNKVITDSNGMGLIIADLDGDLDNDWFVTGLFGDRVTEVRGSLIRESNGNRYYQNKGNDAFSDTTEALQLADGGWAWGACAIDIDLDGTPEIFHTNGFDNNLASQSFSSNRDRLYKLSVKENKYYNRSKVYGMDKIYQGRGVVCADFDQDGDVDIFVATRDFPLAFTYWRNDQTHNRSLTVTLKGRSPNTEASGARIYATSNEVTQMKEVMIGNNYSSQNPAQHTIGIGQAESVDTLIIEWPNGQKQTLSNIAAGLLTVTQPEE